MSRVVIIINGEPRPKARPRMGEFGIVPDRNSEAEEAHIRQLGRKKMAGRPPMVGPIRVRLEAVFSFPISWPKRIRDLGRIEHMSKPDLDNIEKLVLDACNGVIFLDDGQVCEVVKRKRYGAGARVEVSFEELETDPFHPALLRAEHRRDHPLPPPAKRKRAAKPADKEKPIGKRIK